jgi:hypothetical protein
MRCALLALSLLAACHARLDDPSPADASEPDLSRPRQCTVLLDNTNIGGVQGGAVSPTVTLPADGALCELWTYHWNNTGGPAGTIGLKNLTTSMTYGPYQAVGSPGQLGKQNVNWDVQLDPRVALPAGDYQVVDSDPASWSWNADSVGGFAKVLVDTGR